MAARLCPGVERNGVLVAGVADAAVAHGGHPRGRLLGEVVARAAGLGAALGAVAVLGDVAAALVTAGACGAGFAGAYPRPGRGRRRSGRSGLADGAGVGPSSAPQASQYCSPARDLGRALGALYDGGGRHRRVHRRTALAWSTSPTRSWRVAAYRARSRYAASSPSRRDGSVAGRPPMRDRRVHALRLDDLQRRLQHLHAEPGPVDRVDGEVVDALQSLGQRARAHRPTRPAGWRAGAGPA